VHFTSSCDLAVLEDAAVPVTLAAAIAVSDVPSALSVDDSDSDTDSCIDNGPAAAALTGASTSATQTSGSLQALAHGQAVPLARAGRPSVPVSLSLRLSGLLPVDPRIAATTRYPYDGNGRSGLYWDRDTPWYFDLDELLRPAAVYMPSARLQS
jgi:hypothetical protein